MQEVNGKTHELKQNGMVVYEGSSNQCYAKLHKICPDKEILWLINQEGYSIEPKPRIFLATVKDERLVERGIEGVLKAQFSVEADESGQYGYNAQKEAKEIFGGLYTVEGIEQTDMYVSTAEEEYNSGVDMCDMIAEADETERPHTSAQETARAYRGKEA